MLQYMVHVMLCLVMYILYLYISTFRSMCAVPNMAVVCSSLLSYFLVMSLRYFLHNFVMVPIAPIMAGIISISTFHIGRIYIIKSLYYYH